MERGRNETNGERTIHMKRLEGEGRIRRIVAGILYIRTNALLYTTQCVMVHTPNMNTK